jgi:excisionase family DNA binding protein
MKSTLEKIEIRQHPPKYLNVNEAALIACVSSRMVRAALSNGDLRSFRIGRRIIIRLEDLEDWMLSST